MTDEINRVKPDLANAQIVEIIFEVNSPPYRNTNVMTFKYAPDKPDADVTWSGLVVSGQRRIYTVQEPGARKITKEQFESLSDLIKGDDSWFALKPENEKRPSSFYSLYGLTVKFFKKGSSSRDIGTIKVESWYFEDNRPSEGYMNLFKEVGEKYSLGEEFYYPHHYD